VKSLDTFTPQLSDQNIRKDKNCRCYSTFLRDGDSENLMTLQLGHTPWPGPEVKGIRPKTGTLERFRYRKEVKWR